MIEKIKIGCRTVLVTEHADENEYACYYDVSTPKITLMRRRGAYRDVTDIYMVSQLLSHILYGIDIYSNLDEGKFDQRMKYLLSNVLLHILKDNPSLLDMGVFNPPRNIRIGAFDFIVDVDSDSARCDNAAEIDCPRGIINVYPNNGNQKVLDETGKWVSLWHEIFHGIFTIYPCDDLNNNERVIDTLAEWWVMVLLDNPEFVELLKLVLSSS